MTVYNSNKHTHLNVRSARKARSTQRGVALAEVVVSLLIVAIGLLGAMSLQVLSMNVQQDSMSERAAAALVSELAERVTANHAWYKGNLGANHSTQVYDASATVNPTVCPSTCTTEERWDSDLATWVLELRRRLPGGVAAITPGGADDPYAMNIIVGWQEIAAADEGADDSCEDVSTAIDNDHTYRCVEFSFYPG